MITAEFLKTVGGFVAGKVVKVVLNGSYEITNFSLRQLSDGLLSLEYTVPKGSVSAISSIELKDSSNQVISFNTVYMPINEDTAIKQTIEVQEE